MKRKFYLRTFALLIVLCVFVNLSLIAGFNRLFVENVYADEGVEFPVSSNKVYVTLKNIKTGVPSDTIALKIGIINLNKAININLDDIKLRYYFTNDGCFPIQVNIKLFGTETESFNPELVKTSVVTGLSYPGADSYVEIEFTGSVELNCDRKPIYIELDIKENSPDRNFDQSNDFSNNNYYTPFLPEEFFASGRVPVFMFDPKKRDYVLLTGVLPSETSKIPNPTPTPVVSPSPSPIVPEGEKILATASGNIIIPKPSPAPVGLFEPADIGFPHEGSIDVGFSPRKKEALILLDSSYESNDVDDGLTGIFKYCLFSSGDSLYQGDNITIEGDVFTRNTMNVTTSGIKITGKVEYSFRDRNSYAGPLGDKEIKMEPADAHRYDRYLVPDENDDYSALFSMIQTKVTNLPEKGDAKFLITEDTVENYISPEVRANPNWRKNAVQFYYDDNDESVSIEYRSKEAGGFSRKYDNSLPQYLIKQDKGDAFVLKSNMFFDGNLIISVNGIRQELIDGATSAFIYAYGDIILQGNGATFDDVYLITKYGNIYIETNNCNVNGIAFAPNGKIVINGQSNNLQGSFVASKIQCEPGNSVFKGPTDDQLEDIEDALKSTEGFDTIRNSIALLPYIFDEYTRAGIITYSDYANINDSPINDSWKFFDAATEREEFLNYTLTLSVDEDSKRSNLGDGLRKALDVFNKYSDPEADKYIYIFTSLDPNAYTRSHLPYGLFETDPAFNTDAAYIYDETVNREGNQYVREIMKLIKEYNNKHVNGKIKLILVDLTNYIKEFNIKNGAKESEIEVDDLTNLAADLGIDISDSDEKAYYCPSLEDIQSLSIINELAYRSNSMPPKLAVENLKISSAQFELSLPSYIKPVELFFKRASNTKESIDKLSGLAASGGKYNITYTFSGDELATLTRISDGLKYDLESNGLYMTLIVNSSDDWDDGDNPLTVKGTVDIAGPKITYKLFDDKNNDGVWSAGEAEFEVVVPFDNIKFNVEYKKDIN